MSKFNKLFILGLLFGLNLGVNAGEGAGDKAPNVWQLFSEQTLIGKLKLAAALLTLDPRFLPADLYPQEQNSRASSVTLEEPMPSASPTFLSHSPVVVATPGQMFRRQSCFGKLRFAAALVTLDPRLLPADLDPQEQNSRASVAAPEPVVVPVRSFSSLLLDLPKSSGSHRKALKIKALKIKALNREEREEAAMSGLIARYREGRKTYRPCFDEPGFKRVFGK